MPLRLSRHHLSALATLIPALLLTISLAGCGGGGAEKPKDAQSKVSGKVLFDGKPITLDSAVVFYCKDKGATASGKVDSLGSYSLTGSIPSIGIPVGRYQVMIQPPSPPPPVVGTEEYKAVMMGKGPKKVAPKDVPEKFHSLESSKIVLEVKEGENTFDFDLSKL